MFRNPGSPYADFQTFLVIKKRNGISRATAFPNGVWERENFTLRALRDFRARNPYRSGLGQKILKLVVECVRIASDRLIRDASFLGFRAYGSCAAGDREDLEIRFNEDPVGEQARGKVMKHFTLDFVVFMYEDLSQSRIEPDY